MKKKKTAVLPVLLYCKNINRKTGAEQKLSNLPFDDWFVLRATVKFHKVPLTGELPCIGHNRELYRGGSRGRVQGVRTPPPGDDLRFSNTTGILKKKTMWFIGVEVEQKTSALPPKKNP